MQHKQTEMFSFNDSWFQEKVDDGEAELHKALFGSTEVSEDAATNYREKRKKNKRRKYGSLMCSDGQERKYINIMTKEDKSCVPEKTRKRKKVGSKCKEDGQNPSKRKKADSSMLTQVSTDSNGSYNNIASQTHSLQSSSDSGPVNEERNSSVNDKGSALRSKVARKIEGARFRWINEQLYTTTGHKAKEMFDEDPTLFDVYHSGFATQVSKWPLNPLDKIIAYVQSLPTNFVIADFGCGEARLAQSVPHSVHSFDLVAANSHITACDMAHVPLFNQSVDIVIFCLSLMGRNVSDFIQEARRVLKRKGLLKICEIVSRIDSVEDFITNVELFGFKLLKMDTISKMFLEFEFRVKAKQEGNTDTLPNIHLNPCIYKRR